MLKVNSINVFYGKVQALNNVSLNVEKGQIIALIGANGAGKSTMLKTISGLLKPAKGDIEFEGKSIEGHAPDEILRLGIAHCPEERHVWPAMTVWENLILGAYSRNNKYEINQDLEYVFEIFPKLKERIKQKAGSFSGGEQQMLAIGRTLMSRPRLIMFDEPSLGLAPLMVEQMAATIHEINQRGTTVLLVEQNAFMALRMADKAYVLETGQIFLEGPGADLLEDVRVKRGYLGL